MWASRFVLFHSHYQSTYFYFHSCFFIEFTDALVKFQSDKSSEHDIEFIGSRCSAATGATWVWRKRTCFLQINRYNLRSTFLVFPVLRFVEF